MSSSPVKQRVKPPRPRITLAVPNQFSGHFSKTPVRFVTPSYAQTPAPLTPVSGRPTIVYSNKANDFFIEHFKEFKDWTMTGLSAGEKCAFWLYDKVITLTSFILEYYCYLIISILQK
jgi:hypothetical protein